MCNRPKSSVTDPARTHTLENFESRGRLPDTWLWKGEGRNSVAQDRNTTALGPQPLYQAANPTLGVPPRDGRGEARCRHRAAVDLAAVVVRIHLSVGRVSMACGSLVM